MLKDHTTAHWLAVLAKAGVPCGPINNIKQALEHPQVAARNMLVEVPDGSGGTLKLAGNPHQDVGLRRSQDATAGAGSRQRPRRHPVLPRRLARAGTPRDVVRLGAGLAKVLAGTVLAILVFLAGAFFQVRGALPPYSGHVEAKGLKAPVEILRDKNAVPHIIAGSIEDAAFGLGYVHAQDRFWQMELMRRLGQGRLSEIVPPRLVGIGPDRHRSHDARPRHLPRGRRQRERALARHARASSTPMPPA